MTTEHVCDECGKSFEAANALGAHKTFKHSDEHQAEYKDPDTLRELYHDKDLSTYEIADKFDVAASTVQKYMKEGDVQRDKSYDDPTYPASHYFDPHGEGVGNAYEIVRASNDGEYEGVYIHRLIAYAHGKLSFSELCDPNIVVHHKSQHGLDNRPGNLEVMSHSDHATHHMDERYDGRPWQDKDKLKDALEGRTRSEAAELLGCCGKTVTTWKQKHGLE